MAAFMKDKAGNKVYEHFRNIENFAIEGGIASETDNAPAVTERKRRTFLPRRRRSRAAGILPIMISLRANMRARPFQAKSTDTISR